MNRLQIEKGVNAVLCDYMGIGCSEIDEMKLLGADYGADSIDEIEITMELEKKFSISINDEDLSAQDDWTVKEVYDLVEASLK